ncbi:MAG: hypothetical protein KKD33_09425 [Verrucomicrobia bacterium]|nr:hypothetical protein [Verrucomicrobiota bacterium]MBU4286129.1 hypothetical protein [Verrucomicrobiota bacterium]MBU4366556.1 hypothetical protein [Verrucomicrobiota bacterium]
MSIHNAAVLSAQRVLLTKAQAMHLNFTSNARKIQMLRLFCLTLIFKLAILHATYGTTITTSIKTAPAETLD